MIEVAAYISKHGQGAGSCLAMPKGKVAEGSPLLVRVGSDRLVNSLSIVIRTSDGALSAFVNILSIDAKCP